MNKYRRKLKCYYWRIKFLIGSFVCLFREHKRQSGFHFNSYLVTLVDICPRCGKILKTSKTQLN